MMRRIAIFVLILTVATLSPAAAGEPGPPAPEQPRVDSIRLPSEPPIDPFGQARESGRPAPDAQECPGRGRDGGDGQARGDSRGPVGQRDRGAALQPHPGCLAARRATARRRRPCCRRIIESAARCRRVAASDCGRHRQGGGRRCLQLRRSRKHGLDSSGHHPRGGTRPRRRSHQLPFRGVLEAGGRQARPDLFRLVLQLSEARRLAGLLLRSPCHLHRGSQQVRLRSAGNRQNQPDLALLRGRVADQRSDR